MFLLVMMGRISENVTAVALSEIRPKVFLRAHLVVTGFHIIRFRCDASSHTILRFCGNPVLLLVASAASGAAGSGFLDGLVASAASGGRSGVRLLVPAKEIGKRHID